MYENKVLSAKCFVFVVAKTALLSVSVAIAYSYTFIVQYTIVQYSTVQYTIVHYSIVSILQSVQYSQYTIVHFNLQFMIPTHCSGVVWVWKT